MIYLDYNATTPIAEEVAQAMQPYINGNYGNPSSSHELGVQAKTVVEKARSKVASLLKCSPEETIFTSGGSESNNMVIKGVAFSYRNQGNHIITSEIEHPAILNPCKFLEKLGYQITYLPVDEYGMVSPSDVEKAITDQTILITIMHANNETGTIQPIKEISRVSQKYNVLFHTDAAQSVGKVPTDVNELGVDFLSIAGHKLYAPKGIGALYIKNGIEIEPLIHGAGHENGRRAGTENVIFEVAVGKACELASKFLKNGKTNGTGNTVDEMKELTDYFYDKLLEKFTNQIKLNGHPSKRLPNTLNISFVGYDGNQIVAELDGIAVSTGSACHTGLTNISPVLKAMSVSEEAGRGAIRFSLGKYTTKEEINTVISQLERIIK